MFGWQESEFLVELPGICTVLDLKYKVMRLRLAAKNIACYGATVFGVMKLSAVTVYIKIHNFNRKSAISKINMQDLV